MAHLRAKTKAERLFKKLVSRALDNQVELFEKAIYI